MSIGGKIIEYVETDLDLYRITRFESVQNGVQVPLWTSRFGPSTTMTGALESNFPSGRAAHLTHSGGNRSLWSWDVLPNMADVSCVALFRTSTESVAQFGIIVRGSGGSGTDTSYTLRFTSGDTVDIIKRVAGSSSFPASKAFPIVNNENLWLRFDAINISGPGVLLRGKAWRGELVDEPDLFTIFAQDTSSPILTAGWTGLGIDVNTSVVRCGHFRARSYLGDTEEAMRLVKPNTYLPTSLAPAVPDLVNVSVSPAIISLGQNLGQRSTVNVEFRDHPGADLGEMFGSGSFWGKFRARKLFRRGAPLRVVRNVIGGTSETRHFVLESFDGPTPNGSFRFMGKDILKFADNDRAQAPRINDGFLSATLTSGGTSATLLPSGIGNLQYAASGYVNISGTETCAFTRSGDVLTLTRAQFGSTAVQHEAEDRVQQCLLFQGMSPDDIISTLLTTYADVPSSYIPTSEWATEVDTYLARVYTRMITDPTGVNSLIATLIKEAGLILWEDNIAQKLRLQVLKGIPVDAFLYDETNVLPGSIGVMEQPESRITQAWTYYGIRNPLEDGEERKNFRSSLATINEEEETIHGSAVIEKVFAQWIPEFAVDTAQRLNDLQLGRFSIPPRKVTFAVMRNSGIPEPEVGGGYRFSYYGAQDEAGKRVNIPIQVTSINPQPGMLQVTAEEMLFKQFDPADLIDRVIVINANKNDFNLKNSHNSIYPAVTADDVLAGVNLTVIVSEGVIVGSSSVATPAFHAGEASDWPANFPILLQVIGRIQGKGGKGGNSSINPDSAAAGENGGRALYTRFPLDLDVDAGEIWGGAGGGGASTEGFGPGSGNDQWGGGGGAGQNPGEAGVGTGQGNIFNGNPGTTEVGGQGGRSSPDGGDGGNPGQSGEAGWLEEFGLSGVGGAAGAAIDGVSFITVVQGPGSILGPQIN